MKIFISHSSADKERYCNTVVNKLIERLGSDPVVYDALTFEAGEKSIDEINRTLALTDLYVILLSQTAVESFIIITKYKTNYESIRNVPTAFFLNVPELNVSERKGLLRRLSETTGLELRRDDLEDISHHLTGYPAQVHYAVNLIKNNGFPYLQRNYKLLSDFNEQEVSSLLEKYSSRQDVLNTLALISKYDAISVSMLYEILNITPDYIDTYEMLLQESFFELEGANREYVRLNEVIKNYIARAGTSVLPEHHKKAHELFEKMFSDDNTPWYNANDFLLAVRENIKQKKAIDIKYMIPSVYLKSMSDLYADMKYDDVVQLARRALENAENSEDRIIYETRYLLCSALAKLKSTELLSEVQLLDNDDKLFLTAFYYRQIGKNDRALQLLNTLLRNRPDMSKAKREKVLVLKNLQQFEEATDLAKENYYSYSDNPYHIQAFLRRCTKGYYIKQPNMDCQPTEFTALSRHRAVFSWAGKGGIPICGA